MWTEFHILGPFEIVVDGRAVPAPAPRLCSLLAILLLRPHRQVQVDELIDRLWPDGAPQPANPTATVHTYVRSSRRRICGPPPIPSANKPATSPADPLHGLGRAAYGSGLRAPDRGPTGTTARTSHQGGTSDTAGWDGQRVRFGRLVFRVERPGLQAEVA